MENELYHHGIKGQKWGVRRYQNADGSLTAEGKKRYSNTMIEKGSTVRRITGHKIKQEKNPLGLYAFGKDSEQEYLQSAKWLPSMGTPTGGKVAKKAVVTQYEFTKNAKLLEGKQAVDSYMKQFGNRTLKDFAIDYPYYALANKNTVTDIETALEINKNDTFKNIYDQFNNAKQSQRAMDWAHAFIHYDVNHINNQQNNDQRTNMKKFVDKHKALGYDAIVDPEDFSGNYTDPLLIINENAVKEVGNYKVKIK